MTRMNNWMPPAVGAIFFGISLIIAGVGVAKAGEAENKNKQPATGSAATPTTTPSTSAEEIKKLIEQLGDNDFKVRDAASKKLVELGEIAISAVNDAIKNKGIEAEVLKRLEAISDKLAIKATLSCDKPLRRYKKKSGFTGQIVFNVTIANRSSKDIRYFPPDCCNATGWRICFKSEQGDQIYAAILTDVNITHSREPNLSAGSLQKCRIGAWFGVEKGIWTGSKQCTVRELGRLPFVEDEKYYMPSVSAIPSGKYVVTASYRDFDGREFATNSIEIEILGFADEIKKMIDQLGNSDSNVRDAAGKRLVEIGGPALPALNDALGKKKADAEMALCLAAIIKQISTATSVEGGVSFCGLESKAEDIVFIMCGTIDQSGFADLCEELLISIEQLNENQNFHLIFYDTTDAPLESPPRQLVVANKENKTAVAKFLENFTPKFSGRNKPAPALKRAFELLKGSKNEHKAIYLVADFRRADEEILKLLNEQNPAGKNQIVINTIIYGYSHWKGSDDFMKKIAAENKGRFKFVDLNE